MGLLLDIHLHTRRHSSCSCIDETQLIDRAVQAGLQGLVITEHHYQWTEQELAELKEQSAHPGFILLSAFEYSSNKGDVLIYGLPPEAAKTFEPYQEPEIIVARAQAMGAACVAAHPTRAEISFDERIATIPFEAIEVQSRNIQPHEQRLAFKLASDLELPATAASDAHRIEDVGAYALEFDDAIQSVADLRDSLKRGRFRIAVRGTTR